MESQNAVDLLAPLKELMPSWWTEKAFLLSKGQWLGILALIFIGLIFEKLVRYYAEKIASRFLKNQGVTLNKEKSHPLYFPLGFVAFAYLWIWALPLFEFPANIHSFAHKAWDIARTIALVWTSYNAVEIFSMYFEKIAEKTDNKFDDVLVPMARKTLKVLVVMVGLIFIGNSFSINMKSIIAGLGIGGLAFALAAKETIANLFGSFTVLIDQPFQIGDYVKIDGKVEGTVEEVGLRSTKVRTPQDSLISLPNGTLINAHIDNFGKRKFRRFDTKLQIDYKTSMEDIEKICAGIRQLIEENPRTKKDNYQVYLHNFGSSALEVLVIVFWDVPDFKAELEERHNFHAKIMSLMKKEKVNFAFPSQSLYLNQVKNEA